MEKKFIYEAPEMEQIKLKLECGQILSGSIVNENNHTEYLGTEEDGGDLS